MPSSGSLGARVVGAARAPPADPKVRPPKKKGMGSRHDHSRHHPARPRLRLLHPPAVDHRHRRARHRRGPGHCRLRGPGDRWPPALLLIRSTGTGAGTADGMVAMTGEAPRAPLGEGAGTLRAAAAVPFEHRHRVVGCLQEQLRVMADAAGATPDWTTLTVTGPVEMPGAEPAARFEWTATVVVRSAEPG